MITVRPSNLQEAAVFMQRMDFIPPREKSIPMFLATCLGAEVLMLATLDTQVLFIIQHHAAEQRTDIRLALKQGPGDAMQLAYQAVKQGLAFAFPTVTTSIQAERLKDKLVTFTNGAALGAQVHFTPDLTPPGGA